MKPVYNFKNWGLILIILILPLIGFAKQKEFTRTVKKDFPITSDGLTGIQNKYGKVYIHTWDKDRVKIEVTITVRANDEESAQKVFDKIKIEFSNTSDHVEAITEIDSQKSAWNWGWNSGKNDYSIDYEVYMPKTNRLALSNKYGDSFVTDISGSADLEIKYGNFQIESAQGPLNIILGYGKGTVAKARDVVADIKYSQFLIKEAKDVELNTRYSKINIEEATDVRSVSQYDSYKINKVRDLRNQGKYDNFEIGSTDNLTIVSKYADIYTKNLSGSADMDLKYGGATFEMVSSGFNEIRLMGSYADYKIHVEDGASYQVDAVADYAGIKYPSALQVTFEKDKGTYQEVNGYFGNKDAKSIIKAKLAYGGLKVY